MKVLLYGLNFAPEPTGVGKYSGEMAFWLSARGHDVHVITAPPYYPEWKVAQGYRGWLPAFERLQGVSVWRTPLWVPKHPTGAKRVLHLLSFAALSLPSLLRQAFWKPDVILVVAPALVCAPAGWLTAKLCGAKSWLHIQDFEIDAAFRLGLLKGDALQRLMGTFERWMLSRFDRVSTISQRMLAVLRSKQVSEARIVSFPNWVDVSAVAPSPQAGAYRSELGIPADAVVALYSGSMAGKQGLDLLPAAARMLVQIQPNLVFVFCGDGVYKKEIEQKCSGLANVRLLPLQPASRLGELLCMADIHLLPQSLQAADLVMPSKLTGMLASGRPVLATAQPRTEVAQVVAGRGVVVPPNDLTAFVAALSTLAETPTLRTKLGLAARRYAEEHLARDHVLVEFERGLRRCSEEANDASGTINLDVRVITPNGRSDDKPKTT